jgi:hypothetical protein
MQFCGAGPHLLDERSANRGPRISLANVLYRPRDEERKSGSFLFTPRRKHPLYRREALSKSLSTMSCSQRSGTSWPDVRLVTFPVHFLSRLLARRCESRTVPFPRHRKDAPLAELSEADHGRDPAAQSAALSVRV